MYNSKLEQRIILPDMESVLADYVSIQLDIDNTRIKAAQNMAMNIDLKKTIGQSNLDRCVKVGQLLYDTSMSIDELPVMPAEPTATITQADKNLFELVVPALCHYTYSRLLTHFHGSYTESGWTQEEFAEARAEARSIGKENKGVAAVYMTEVIEFINAEAGTVEQINDDKLTPRVRVIGGKEYQGRGSYSGSRFRNGDGW